jgi:hypothetical protein
LATR